MPYRLRKRLCSSMDGNETVLDDVCKQCNPAFAKIVEGFCKLVHQGSELKKRKKRYPAPKHEDRVHYRNVVAQNEWIRGNIFDAMGNYLFCHELKMGKVLLYEGGKGGRRKEMRRKAPKI